MYALGALSAELIFAQAILKEIGLSFQTAAQHEILIHSRFGISENFNDVISQD